MKTLKKVNNWKLVLDDLMGVTSIINESIGFQSDWNTGYDAQEEFEMLEKMSDEEFITYCTDMIPLPFEDNETDIFGEPLSNDIPNTNFGLDMF